MKWKNMSEGLLLSASQCWFSKVPKTQKELVELLTGARIIKSPQVISVLENIDRGLFTNDIRPYENRPVNIHNDEVMTSPSTHGITLEMLMEKILMSKSILDLGCGTGYLSQCFASLNPVSQVLGVDFHKALISKAKNLNKFSNLEFRHCEAHEIIEESFDIINVGFTASEDLYKTLSEMAKNGVLLCPVKKIDGNKWVVRDKNEEFIMGEVAFSPMRFHENLQSELDALNEQIKNIIANTEKNLNRRPGIQDFPKEIHDLLNKRRKLQARIKRLSPPSNS